MQTSHKMSHKTSHCRLPPVAHTIQRNGVYHYKKRVDRGCGSTMVQCSLRTSDPALARYYVAIIDREIMKPEHDKKTIINRIMFKFDKAELPPPPGFCTFKVGRNGKIYPESKIKIGDVEIDYDGDMEKEIAVARQLFGANVFIAGGTDTKKPTPDQSLSAAMKAFLDYQAAYKKWSKGTIKNSKNYLKRYYDYIGTDSLFGIDEQRHYAYGHWLLTVAKIGGGTANQELSKVNSFFIYARKHCKVDLLPIDRVPEAVVKSGRVERVTFRPENISDIANAMEYLTVQQRIIIALCFVTGARVGEIGQLLVADVKSEGNITYIDVINEDEDDDEFEEFKEKRKTVKNLNSKRLIPLPDALTEHIVALCNTAKRKGKKQLFFSVNDDVSGGRGGNASRTFLRRLREAGYGPEYVTHSARYMFKQVAHVGKMDEAWTEKVMGHASQRTGRRVYLAQDLEEMKVIVDFVTNKHLLPLISVLKVPQKRKKYTRKPK